MKKKTDMEVVHELFERFPTSNKTILRHNPNTIYKKVLLPITVTDSDYCRDQSTICNYFSNEGGHLSCDLDLGALKYNAEGNCPKPKKCLELKEA